MRETPGRRMASMRCLFVFLTLLCASLALAAPPRIATFTFNPNPVLGGNPTTGRVTLTAAAPKGGAKVLLASNNTTLASVPAFVTVPQGQTFVTFGVNPPDVTATSTATVTATYNNSISALLTVKPPALSTVQLNPQTVTAVIQSSTATVYMDRIVPAGGMIISLSTNNPAVVIPPSVVVPGGSMTTTFTITTRQVAAPVTALIFAQSESIVFQAPLNINPCTQPQAGPPSLSMRDVLWVDDTLPAGMSQGGNPDYAQRASGSFSHTLPVTNGYQEMLFTGATATLNTRPSEDLFVWLLPSVCEPPREVMIGWHTVADDAWTYTWLGQPVIGGEAIWPHYGAMPSGGSWYPVIIPAAALGIAGMEIDGISIATPDGKLWVDAMGKRCAPDPAPAVLEPTDTVWIDDLEPAGATTSGYEWDTTQVASGFEAIHTGFFSSTALITGGTPELWVENDTQLVAYALLSDCAPPPPRIAIKWMASGWSKGATWGEPFTGPEASNYVHMGPLPAVGQWTRLEVPSRTLGFEGRSINGIEIRTFSGEVWLDAIGVSESSCIPATAPAPAVPAGDTVWIDDALPTGASFVSLNGELDASQHASGTSAISTSFRVGAHNAAIYGATQLLDVYAGENLVAYFMTNECLPPTGVEIAWYEAGTGSLRGVYYGTAINPNYGFVSMGPLPAPGVWQRVEIPARQLNFEQKSIQGVSINTSNGEAWLDLVGKSGIPCFTATASQPSIPSTDVVAVDDALPPDAPGSNITWDSTQAASGSLSMTVPGIAPGGRGFSVPMGNAPLPIFEGDTLVFYVLLDECTPPTELLVRWWPPLSGGVYGRYWGTSHGQDQEGLAYEPMGPMPAAGSWMRIELPAADLEIENKSVRTVSFKWYDGRAWIDSVGKTGCLMPPASAPSLPPTDTVLVDDSIPAGYIFSGGYWTTHQAARGAKSLSMQHGPAAPQYMNIQNFSLPVVSGEKFVFYALNDACLPGTRMAIRLYSGNVWREVVWGTPTGFEPPDAVFVGALGAPGTWTRYEVAVDAVGMAGLSIQKVEFLSNNGHFFVDSIGKGQ